MKLFASIQAMSQHLGKFLCLTHYRRRRRRLHYAWTLHHLPRILRKLQSYVITQCLTLNYHWTLWWVWLYAYYWMLIWRRHNFGHEPYRQHLWAFSAFSSDPSWTKTPKNIHMSSLKALLLRRLFYGLHKRAILQLHRQMPDWFCLSK